jgi:Fe-S cluster assembly iron-binding protein IscA
MTEVFVPTPIHLTERAVSKAKELISGEGNPDLHLRVLSPVAVARDSSMDSVLMKSIKTMTLR